MSTDHPISGLSVDWTGACATTDRSAFCWRHPRTPDAALPHPDIDVLHIVLPDARIASTDIDDNEVLCVITDSGDVRCATAALPQGTAREPRPEPHVTGDSYTPHRVLA